jgi:hypothetical protein
MSAVATYPDYSGFAYALVLLYLAMKLWQRMGGWPEAYYRIRGWDYFAPYIFAANKRIIRKIIPAQKWTKTQPPFFKWEGGDYQIASKDNELFANPRNAPAGAYNYDDARPIPVFNRTDDKSPPQLINAAFSNNALERYHKLNEKKQSGKVAMEFLVLMLILLFSALAMYYSYNTACAIHSPVCVGVK